MSKETLVFIAGILLTITPFFGIPESWKNIAVIALGIVLLIIGYSQRRAVYLSNIDHGNGERGTNSFVETTQPMFEERPLH